MADLKMTRKKNIALRVGDEALKGRLISRLVSRYSYWLGGFYTVENRKGSVREGYLIKTPGGRSEIMASKTLVSPVLFNKYGVNLAALDGLAAGSLSAARSGGKIALMDELGPLSLSSEKLSAAVFETLASPVPCLAAFRKNAGKFENAFARMDETDIIDPAVSGETAVRAALDAWAEYWIEKLKVK